MKSCIARWAVIGIVAMLALWGGLRLRNWIYPATEIYRFSFDINNAWEQGSLVLDAARAHSENPTVSPTWGQLYSSYLTRYDAVIAASPDERYRLDYPPVRLLIMSAWVWANSRDATKRSAPIEKITWPLLVLNTTFELAGCVAAYLLVRSVLHRQNNANADLIALLPALLMWFNLPAILDAHVWPQWDVWLVPFYLFAAYFGVTRRWLLSGVFVGAGALLKGQMLLIMPLFILWPLFQLRLRAVLEVVSGTLLAAMVYVSPWMLRTTGAWVSFCVILIAVGTALYWIPRGSRTLFVCTSLGASILLAGLIFDGSFGWYRVGFEYGTRHYQAMTMGPALNLAALLASKLRWQLATAIEIGWPINTSVPVRTLLLLVYGVSLLLCSIGLARHDTRNDRRMLIAFAAPWVLMFAFLAQMHERYLVWGALLTALAAGVSLGTTLLHIVVTFLAFLPIGYHLLVFNRQFDHPLMPLFQGTWPDASWGTVLVALALLYLAITRSRISARSTPAGGALTLADPRPAQAFVSNRQSQAVLNEQPSLPCTRLNQRQR
jgi:hypothetical protein